MSARSLQARAAAHALHSQVDGREITRAARKAGPGSLDYWERRVDPDAVLSPAERTRRAAHAKKAHYIGLAAKSAAARKRKAPAQGRGSSTSTQTASASQTKEKSEK